MFMMSMKGFIVLVQMIRFGAWIVALCCWRQDTTAAYVVVTQQHSPQQPRPSHNNLLKTFQPQHGHGCFASHRGRSACLWAKRPPIDGMDLDAIEAFEAQLDRQVTRNMGIDDSDKHSATSGIKGISLWNLPDLDRLARNHCDDDDDGNHNDDFHSGVESFVVPPHLDNKRSDAALAVLLPGQSRSFCGNLISEGRVHCVDARSDEQSQDSNGVDHKDDVDLKASYLIDRKSFKVSTGQILLVRLPESEPITEILPQELPLDILYEDEHMIVINKAANMVVHPAAGNWDGTIVNALAYYLLNSPFGAGDILQTGAQEKNLNDDPAIDSIVLDVNGETTSSRPGIVHRLDKGTTGVLVVAKTTHALTRLSDAFAERRVRKTYLAITVGNPGRHVTIDQPIGRHPVHRQRMRVVPDPHQNQPQQHRLMLPIESRRRTETGSSTGKRAVSHVNTIAFDGRLSLVQVRIETGRTHQIRVHLQYRQTPIYGDDIYGLYDWNQRLSKTHQIERPLLHAYQLQLNHPSTGQSMVFTAPLAPDMLRVAKAIYPQGEHEAPEIFGMTS